jgi:hypothetical protein
LTKAATEHRVVEYPKIRRRSVEDFMAKKLGIVAVFGLGNDVRMCSLPLCEQFVDLSLAV